jgi:hypothetical protein
MIKAIHLMRRKDDDVSGKHRRHFGSRTGLTLPFAVAKDDENSMPSRRLEDRIRYLCHEALTSKGAEFESVLGDLRASLHEHSERLRQIMALRLATKTHAQVPDRRAHQQDGV